MSKKIYHIFYFNLLLSIIQFIFQILILLHKLNQYLQGIQGLEYIGT